MSSRITDLIKPYRFAKARKFRLEDVDPSDTGTLKSESRDEAQALLKRELERLSELQEKLYAQNHWAVLLVFQAMDAAGKDSTIKHVMSGVNPQGCQVYSFKAPSGEELDHDFMWRTSRLLPERGRIGIFNRSYYEEVLVVRVHQELVVKQHLPPKLVTKRMWRERFEDISNFETYLARNGVAICKFFLHVSKEEQKKRFLERIDKPEKNWKFEGGDVTERRHWNEYMDAYEDIIRRTAAPHAPWYVVPADNKWYTRLVVAGAVIDTLNRLDLAFPKVDATRRKALRAARNALIGEDDRKR